MKKIFGISLIGILAAMPMFANAATVAEADPGETTPSAAVASHAPKYALEQADSTVDGYVVTAGYVKGAYNAAIKGVNYVQSEIESANSALTSANNELTNVQNTLAADYATQSGVVATVKSATTTGTFSSATVSGTFDSAAITGSVTGSAIGTIPAMKTWGSSTVETAPATAALSGATVSGNASGSVTGTANGTTSGTVSVASYLAS
jgi:hypothetical protein